MIKVLGDRVLVALPPRQDEFVSQGGIVLVKDPDRLYAPTQGIVVQVGEKSGTVSLDEVIVALEETMRGSGESISGFDETIRLHDETMRAVCALDAAPFDVEVGDCVLFSRAAGEEVRLDGIDYVILREAELLGIVEPAETEAA